jgi:hypothetical protein
MKGLLVRRATVEDYSEICRWWKSQGKMILGWEVLPVLSFLCEEDDTKKPLGVCWLYNSDSVTGFVGWMTISPECPKRKMPVVIRALEQSVEDAAKVTGRQILFQFSGGGGFSRLLLKSGWFDSAVKHDLLVKEV